MRMRRRFDRWFRPDDFARREIDDEIAAHLEARVEHLIAHGMSAEDARAEAMRRFGDIEGARVALLQRAQARHRRVAMWDRFEQGARDIRFVVRSLCRNPSFSLGVIATFALGLGVNAAVFRVADQVLIRAPGGVSHPDQLRRVEASAAVGQGAAQRVGVFSYPEAQRVLESGAFDRATMYTAPRVQSDAESRSIAVTYVDARHFAVLGARLFRGRGFEDREAAPGSSPGVTVVSHGYWQSALGGSNVDDRLLVTLGGRRYRVVGVAEPQFRGIEQDPVDVWIPFGDANLGRGEVNGVVIPWHRSEMLRAIRIIGRVVPGDEGVAREKLTSALTALEGQFTQQPRDAHLMPIVPAGDASANRSVNQLLVRVAAVAGIILLMAGANAVNLLLARGLRRGREIGIRFAVGASRARVARLLLLESVTLALVAASAAFISGHWTADALRRIVLPDSRWTADSFDRRTLLFTGLAAILAGVAAGLVPALQSTRGGLAGVLKQGRAPNRRAGRTRATLLIFQTALSLALVAGSGLLVRSLVRLHAVDLGFDPTGLVIVSPGGSERSEQRVLDLAESLSAAKEVRGVALASIAPFGATAMIDITVPGSPFVPDSSRDLPFYSAVSESFFTVMGVRVVRGRGLLASDVAGSDPVAVVNEAMARRYWGSASPFSSCILAPPNACARVVGVVSDVQDAPGGAPAPMRFYLPLVQSTNLASVVVIRTEPQHVPAIVAGARRQSAGPRPPVVDIVAERVGRALRPWKTATLLFAALGALALTIACVGIYSVASYLVAERVHEMGIRLALGATAAEVVRLVLSNGLRLVLLGVALGLVVAAAVGRVIGTLLFEVSPVDPGIYTTAAVLLIVLATVAMLPPAIRASRVDPVDTLRAE